MTAVGLTIALSLTSFGFTLGHPQADLFWHLAEIGSALFIAYSAGLVGLGQRIGTPSHRNWLAGICTIGFFSLTAIALSIALAAFRAAGNSGWIDQVGFFWIVANLILTGSLVALLPIVAASWREPEGEA